LVFFVIYCCGNFGKIKEKRFNLLWKKNKGKNSIPVLQWDRLAKPKLFGVDTAEYTLIWKGPHNKENVEDY